MIAWRIDTLDPALRPALADACAAWNLGQWGTPRGDGLETHLALFHKAPRLDRIPMTFVAVAVGGATPGAAIGMASLWARDGAGTEDRTPWLASLYVHPDARRLGIATALVGRVTAEALRLGHKTLNLFTTDAVTFYERLGWQVRQVDDDRVFLEKTLA